MLTYILDSNSKTPIYEQLYSLIKNDINTGNIAPDEMLPSKRKLANHLKISIITVENAYGQLLAEGYIYSKPRKGYFATSIDSSYLSIQNKKVPEISSYKQKSYKYEFKTNSVDTQHFPFSTWSKLLREVLRDKDKSLLNKSEPKGIYELRYEISVFLKEFRNIDATPRQIIIGAGSEYLINIIIQLLGSNKVYGIENPGYQKIPKILKANNIEPQYINLDNEGVKIDELNGIDILHITPSHQFPLGIVTPIRRRHKLLQWANETGGYIIEDDYDSEFRFTGKPLDALQSLDKGNRVIYLNTFTKNLAPALRISYMVLPKELLEKYEHNFQFYSNTVSCFEQHTLAKFIEKGHYERYINRMRLIYKERIDLITNYIENSNLKNVVRVVGGNVGLHILLELKKHSEQEFIKTANNADINFSPCSDYYNGEISTKPAVIMGYSGINTEDIKKALHILSQCF